MRAFDYGMLLTASQPCLLLAISAVLVVACCRGAHRPPGHARSLSDTPASFTYGQLGALPMYTAIRAKAAEVVRQEQQPKTPKVLKKADVHGQLCAADMPV